MSTFTEATVEDAALSWVGKPAHAILHGLEVAPDVSVAKWLAGQLCGPVDAELVKARA